MEKNIPNQYKLAVYDLRDPLTIGANSDGPAYGESKDQHPIILQRGNEYTLGRPTSQNELDIKLIHRFVSRNQGKIEFDEGDRGFLPGILYTDFGRNKPVPYFTEADSFLREGRLLRGERTRIYPGESLKFADSLELCLENLD